MIKSKDLTRTGFKRIINRKYKLAKGYARVFEECKKCKAKAFRDYVPYSLSNPILTSVCEHRYYETYKSF